MFCERNEQHKKPYLHTEYQGQEIVITLEGEVLVGDMPNKQLKML
jgi:hypothetical protein